MHVIYHMMESANKRTFFFLKECSVSPTDSRITFLYIPRVGNLKNFVSSVGRNSIRVFEVKLRLLVVCPLKQ